MLTNKEVNQIIDEVFENGFVDDNEGGKTVYYPNVVLLKINTRADVEVCGAYEDTRYFSVNRIYISEKDGKAHLSVGSVGGTVDLRHVSNLEEAVAEYNTNHLTKEGYSRHILMPVRKTAA